MEEKIVNIVVGINAPGQEEEFSNGLIHALESVGAIRVGDIVTVDNVADMDAAVDSGHYDVAICYETLNDKPIGSGSVRRWSSNRPDLVIVLILLDNRYGGSKALKLYDQEYYDALFLKDFSNAELLNDIILNSRSEEEAFEYYGISRNDTYRARQRKSEEQLATSVSAENGSNSKETHPGVNNSDVKFEDERELQPAGNTAVANDNQENASYTGRVDAEKERLLQQSLMDDMSSILEEPLNDSLAPHTSTQPVQSSKDRGFDTNVKAKPVESVNEHSEDIQPAPKHSQPILNNQTTEPLKQEKVNFDKTSESPDNNVPVPVSREERVDEHSVCVITKVDQASIVPHEGFVVCAVSDTALLVEIPGAHFMDIKGKIPNMPVNLITPPILDRTE